MTARRLLLACVLIGAAANAGAQQAPSRFLAREDILLYGIGLRVEPEHQTLPRDIATIVSTFLQAPSDPGAGLPPFAPDAVVRATLRGPSFATALDLTTPPNTPFNIPPLTVAGLHTLENIRLVSGGDVVLRGSPESVRIDVIDRLLVTQVTARALTAAEIRERGLVFDKSSFQAYSFSAAFAVDSGPPVQINFPVVLPTLQGAADAAGSSVDLNTIDPPMLQSLATIIPDTLKLQTRIPNLSVVGFSLKARSIEGQSFFVPPIPGVVVIPGDIGFLNQVFSVLLMVANVAPAGSNLVVSELQARIVLPPGRDTVVGSADDPLIMGRTAAGETPRLKLVSQAGPDGQLETADDILGLGPGETGNAEFLVEGRREGSHFVEMELSGTLNGLPIGPVPITGRAAGAVLVRNPTFTLTFTHPEVVNAGEPYSLDVTITNTSDSPANFVSLNLYDRNVSGASVVGDPTREVESIPAGDSATVTFDLVSRITGRVTAATLDSDENVAGRFGLKTAVGELGIPLSPDSLVLPKEASSLPKSLRDAALGLLGKAYAVATAPAAALPRDVKRFSKKIVWDRAVEVAEAGFRFTLHEPMPDTAAQLLMDFAGSGYARLGEKNPLPADLAFAQDDAIGFDEIRRRSVRGNVFAQSVAAILSESVASLGAGALHHQLATKWSYRAPHLSVLSGGQASADVVLIAPTGERLGPSPVTRAVERGIRFSDYLTFGPAEAPTGSLALVATVVPGEYVIRIEPRPGAVDAPFDLSVIVPNADGTLRQIRFDGLRMSDGPVVTWNGTETVRFRVEMAGAPSTTPRSASLDSAVVDPPPSILGVIQFAEGDVLVCEGNPIGHPGRVVAVLFSEEVTAASVQDRLPPADLTSFQVDGNAVVGVALQPGRRIAFLALRDPIGPFIERQLTATGVMDRRGQAMTAQSVPIEITVTDSAGVVSGQVLQADGTPVAFASIRLLYTYFCRGKEVVVGISSKSTDEQGRYSWDFVLKDNITTKIIAVDQESGAFRDLRFSVARHAQRLNVNIVFLGRGAVAGRVFREDGRTAVAGAAVRVTSLTDQSEYGATANDAGDFTIGGIPVGNILIEVVSTSEAAQIVLSENIPFAGATVRRDISLLDVDMTGPQVTRGRVFGHVIREDGTAVRDVPITAYYQTRSQVGVRCPGLPGQEPPECPIALVRTDADGAFAFENLPSGSYRMYAVDQAALQQGQARIVLQPNGVVEFNLVLAGGLGTVRGRVVDPAGEGVADASVGGGLSLATTNANGEFLLPDVPIGRRSIVAVSDALGSQGIAEIDLIQDGDEVNVTIVLPPTASVAGTILAADGVTPMANINVYLFKDLCGGGICVVGQATSNAQGGYRIDRVPLGDYMLSAFRSDFADGNIRAVTISYFRQVFRADLRFRGGSGRVTGVVLDDDGATPLQAAVSVSGDQLVIAGGMVGARFEHVHHFSVTETNFTTGRFAFGGGVWVGPFTVSAIGQFSPDPVTVESNMPAAGATVDVTLRLQSTSQIAGVVYQPDGVTPVGADVIVRYKSDAVKVICTGSGDAVTCTEIPQGIQEETVVTNAAGEYWLPVVNAGAFTLTAEDPATGKVARVRGAVRSGERAELTMRLAGRGQITIEVRGSDSVTPIPGARIEIEQVDFPNKILTGYLADNQGVLQLTGGDSFSEGQFVVTAVDVRNGFAGRASGRISLDGETVVVRVFLYNATGTVSGHVFRADGFTPVPNAEVVISNQSGPLAFAVTDTNGVYEQDTIPLGPFQVDVFEAATASRGFGTGRIDLDHQVVPVDVSLAALGVVRGFVTEAGTGTPLKGWMVSLRQTSPSGRLLPERVTTTGVDGGFSFPGSSVGPFVMSTSHSGFNGVASVNGNVERPGAVVEVPLVVTVIRPAFGRIQGTVFDADGTPAANSQVQLPYRNVTVTAGADGRFVFESVPLGRFLLAARSQTNNNAGSQWGELNFDGSTVDVPITLVGLSQVNGSVRHADGSAAAGVQVTLSGSPATGCAGPCVIFTDAGGAFTFTQIAARTFSVTALDTVSGLSGSVGDTLNPGETRQVSIVLQPSRQITGRVLSASGRPAAGIVTELVRGAEHLFVETAADGTFVYPSVVIGAYTLTLSDPIGPGLAQRNVNVVDNVALGDVVLDENDPTVVEMTPQNFSIGVPRTTPLVIRFSEPLAAGTVSSSSIVLRDASGPLPAVVTLGSGDTVATITPIAPLRDQTSYSISVTGIEDRLGKPMRVPFAGSFITEDVTVPTLIDAAPAAGANGVPIDTTVRLKYSEGLDTDAFVGAPIQVRGPTGVLVPGRLDFLFGNTVIVFTPNIPLAENTSYTATVAPAVDLAGNHQAAGVSISFSTTDRTPPAVLTLDGPDSVIENDTAAFVAGVGTADVAVVDFFVNDVFVAAVRSAPFTLRLQAAPTFGAPGQQMNIHAIATDTSGNRGPASTIKHVTVVADQPPAVTIAPPASGLSARNGERVTVQVTVVDDLGATQIAFRPTTGVPADAANRTIQPAAASRTETFAFNVPMAAAPGSTIQIEASAVDTRGQTTQAVPALLTVTDATPPVTSISGVSTGDRVRPGQRATAVVVASDLGGIASVGFTVSGAATLTETRPISPAQNSVGVAFSFDVSASARPTDSVFLDAFAVDASGNRTNAARVILPVADSTPPTVRIRPANGRLEMVPGRPVDVIVDAGDELAISRLELIGSGAFTLSTARQVSPPLPNAATTFAIDVPAAIVNGAELTLQARAVDLSGNVSTPVSIVLIARGVTEVTLPASLIVIAGETGDFPVTLSTPAPAGGLLVELISDNANVAAPLPSILFAEGESTRSATVTGISGGTVALHALVQNIQRASMTVTVRGGIVRGTVLSPQLAPVVGAQVTVTGGGPMLTTVTDSDGRYFVEGASGAVTVTVRALDPLTQLLGFATGQMNRINGFVDINVVLIAAGAFDGQVVDPAGAPAGAGVQVRLFEAGTSSTPVSTTFTDADGRWLFPLVAIGNYLIDATDAQGNHGVSSASITASGQEVTVPVTYLGRGAVRGMVRNAAGSGIPNAIVTLQSQSLFGTAPSVTRNADSDGSFRFDGVFIGTFSVSATDPVSGLGGAAGGSITSHAQEVEANIALAATANLQGTVFRSDGTTPVGAGAIVTVQYCLFDSRCFYSATTDAAGHYAFTFLPLGSFTVTVSEPSTRGRGSIAGSLSVNGENRTIDVTLLPQGSLAVTVRNADDAPIAGALVTVVEVGNSQDPINGIADPNGQVIFERVLAGGFSITASAAGLSGHASGVLAASVVMPVVVRLEATATIRGTLFQPDGQTPATGGRIMLHGIVTPFPSYIAEVGGDGSYSAEGIRLNTYNLSAIDESGRARANLNGVVLTTNGQIETRDFVQVGLGTVRGRVINPDSSSASDMDVSVQSLHATFGRFFGDRTDAAGFYEVTGVALGEVIVRTGDSARSLLGEARGALTQHGEELVLDVLLQNNATSPVASRFDGNGSVFQTQQDGSIVNGTASVYFGADGSQGGFRLQLTPVGGAVTPFTGASIGTLEDGGQELAIRQPVVGATGLDVTRKIFIPQDGYFARYLEVLTNPTASDITVDVRVLTSLRFFNQYTVPRATSDGNTQLNLGTDHWVALDDNTEGDPLFGGHGTPVAFVFDAPGATAPITALSYPGNAVLNYQWRVTVPANGQVALMHFGVQQTSRAAAAASASRLVQLPPEALAGLSPSELAAIRNFVVPADGLSAVAPLPRIDGRITGRVLEADGTTVVPNAAVKFVSSNLLFGRQFLVSANASGVFTVAASLVNRQPVAIDGFTLTATYPSTEVLSPAVTGTFGAGATTAAADIVFSNLGRVAGVLRRHNGTAVTGAFVQLSGPNYSQQRNVASDGSFSFGGLGAGTFTFATQTSHPQGSGVRNQPTTVTLTAGQSATNLDLFLQPTGVLQGTLRTGAGVAVPNRWVELFTSSFSRQTLTDTSGRFTSTEIPVGTYTLRSFDPLASIYTTRQFDITQDQTTTADLTDFGLGTVIVTVTRANGAPAANVNVNLQSFNNPQFSFNRNGVTDANGLFQFTAVPVGPYRVMAYPGVNSATLLATSAPFTVDAHNAVVPVTVTMAPYGSVRGSVLGGNGVVGFFAGSRVEISSPSFHWETYTDANGLFALDGIPLDTPFSVSAGHWRTSQVRRTLAGQSVAVDGAEVIADFVMPAIADLRITVLRSDGQPFPNARIYTADALNPFFNNRGTTNTLGRMELYGFPEGEFTVQVRDPNTGVTLHTHVGHVVPADEATFIDVTITLTALIGNVEGTVFVADGVTPLVGSYVYAYDTIGNFLGFASTEDGFYRFTNLQSGEHGFVLRAFAPEDGTSVEIAAQFNTAGETQTINLIVPVAPLAVSGRVFADDGATPLPNVRVELYSGDNFSGSMDSDAQGAFAFASSLMNTSGGRLRARLPGTDHRYEQPFTVPAGGVLSVDFTLPVRIGSVSGIVTAADGTTRLPGARVYAFYDIVVPPNCECDDRINLGEMNTDNDGRFAFAGIIAPVAGFVLSANSPNFTAYVQQDVVFPVQQAVVDDIVLAVPVALLSGNVTFQNGDPVPDPTVFATMTGGGTWFANTNEQGHYSIEGLPNGDFTLTAQDPGSGLTASIAGTFSSSSVQRLDAVLPPSTAVLVRAIGSNGTPLPSVTVVMVAGSFQRQIVTDANGDALFAQVAEGSTYVQARWHDGTGFQFTSANLEVGAAGGDMTVTLQFGAGGTVSGVARDQSGTPLQGQVSIRVMSFGSVGPLGSFDRTILSNSVGEYSLPNVPAGLVQVIVGGSAGIANGIVTGATTTIDVTVGNARALPAILSGTDGFRYDLQTEGYLNDGGTLNSQLRDAYDGMYRQSTNNVPFPSVLVAEQEVTDREFVLGPRPNGRLLVTRKVFVPATGGFARYLEIVTNTSATATNVNVVISGNLGSDGSTLLQVSPVATNNTYAVTRENFSGSSDPSLAHVFAGAGAVASSATASFSGDNGTYSWQASVPAGGTAIFMHFAVQRHPTLANDAETQAIALVNLTDPNALANLSAAERAAIRNFVVP